MPSHRSAEREGHVAAVHDRAAAVGQQGRFRRVPHRVHFALDRVPLEQSAVLDVGCSFGQALIHFGPGSLGVDNAAPAVAFCRSIGLQAEQLDVERDDLAVIPDDAFDYVWISDILEHIDAPRVLLRRLVPKLGPNGRVVLFTSVLPENRLARTLARRAPGMHAFDADVHFHQFTVSTVEYLLKRAALRPTRRWVPVPDRFARLSGVVPVRIAPRLLIEAEHDESLEDVVLTSEQRNAGL